MKAIPFSALTLLALTSLVSADEKDGKPYPIGYTDTPLIFEGSKWKVHDIDRPRPDAVKPGDKPGAPPADAIVLFDGKDVSRFAGKEGAECPWKIENGELLVAGGDIWTKESYGSCQFHIEWKSDPNTAGNSQKKGNSGVFFMDRYETQILDCYNNPTYADGMAGCVYGQTPPLVNAVRPAGEWQVYDVIFTAPKLDKGKVVEPAYITTIINGIVVQNHTKILGPTHHKQATNYDGDFPEKAPLRFQDHKNSIPDRFRNLWVRPM
ncbi:MAG: hypothetical protein JWO89_2918 [Verrucomicrobiaceae bacterium]|nr:hypothetical protein [Verrucomicrobiaceae bacterium]MDB6117879.1 hypothetical protein [Verrucomicrobiaceae bacterium]